MKQDERYSDEMKQGERYIYSDGGAHNQIIEIIFYENEHNITIKTLKFINNSCSICKIGGEQHWSNYVGHWKLLNNQDAINEN